MARRTGRAFGGRHCFARAHRFRMRCKHLDWSGASGCFQHATTAVSLPLAFIRVAPSRIVIAGIILVTLTYFAVADWLYMARLAGYVCIAEMPDALRIRANAAPQLEPARPHRPRRTDPERPSKSCRRNVACFLL